MSGHHLLLNETIGRRSITGSHHTIFNRQPVSRLFIHNRNIQITVKNNRQCSWNRRRTHNKHMGLSILTFHRQLLSLTDTKAMLFICNDQCQFIIYRFFLKKCLRTNNHICFMIINLVIYFSFNRCGHGTC